MNKKYDAVLFMSFGGPEGMGDVVPFLDNVLRGKNVPEARKLEVARHYERFGGVSPINGNNRRMIAALERELHRHGIDLPVYFGNRNWHPFAADTLRRMRDAGIRSALAFFTSAFSCYSGCRQYREDIQRARETVGDGAPRVDKLRMFFNHPGFVRANADHLREALDVFPAGRREKAAVLFTAHSLPLAMAGRCDYVRQLTEACRLVAEDLNLDSWRIVYQSRSGPPSQPWLEPDVRDTLKVLKEEGVQDVAIEPIGFISDHMEVVFDLDTEARELCGELGLGLSRAKTAGTHPAFIGMIRELIEERLADAPERKALGEMGPWHDVCPEPCCLSGRPEAGSR